MLKTNSKKLKEKIKKEVTESVKNYVTEQNDYLKIKPDFENFSSVANFVYNIFLLEECGSYERLRNYYHFNEFKAFEDWQQGLNGVLYNNYFLESAVNYLGFLLEQTQEERNKYTEAQAENLTTLLYYNVLNENITKETQEFFDNKICDIWKI